MARPDKLIVGIMMFSFFLVGSVFIYGDLISSYELNTTTSSEGANFSAVYNPIKDAADNDFLVSLVTWINDMKATITKATRIHTPNHPNINSEFTSCKNPKKDDWFPAIVKLYGAPILFCYLGWNLNTM